MCALSNHIRERPNWWEEVKDKVTLGRWREEFLRQQTASEETPSNRLTPAMVKALLYLNLSPVLSSISRSTTYSRNSKDTRLCVIR